jgi:hypothetical protein
LSYEGSMYVCVCVCVYGQDLKFKLV